jgi:hypothetical protein
MKKVPIIKIITIKQSWKKKLAAVTAQALPQQNLILKRSSFTQ